MTDDASKYPRPGMAVEVMGSWSQPRPGPERPDDSFRLPPGEIDLSLSFDSAREQAEATGQHDHPHDGGLIAALAATDAPSASAERKGFAVRLSSLVLAPAAADAAIERITEAVKKSLDDNPVDFSRGHLDVKSLEAHIALAIRAAFAALLKGGHD